VTPEGASEAVPRTIEEAGMADQVPFSILNIDHIVLRTGDVQRLVAFYRDVLGLPIERETGKGLTQLRAGAALIDIVPVDDRALGDPKAPGRNLEHFCLRAEPFDVDAIHARVAAAGARVVKSGTGYGAEGRGPNIYFLDPDGNEVELKGPSDGKLYGRDI
jgi:catechol 2,3-dioxygenase-like lactoylglutathione lyase family enzyme